MACSSQSKIIAMLCGAAAPLALLPGGLLPVGQELHDQQLSSCKRVDPKNTVGRDESGLHPCHTAMMTETILTTYGKEGTKRL